MVFKKLNQVVCKQLFNAISWFLYGLCFCMCTIARSSPTQDVFFCSFSDPSIVAFLKSKSKSASAAADQPKPKPSQRRPKQANQKKTEVAGGMSLLCELCVLPCLCAWHACIFKNVGHFAGKSNIAKLELLTWCRESLKFGFTLTVIYLSWMLWFHWVVQLCLTLLHHGHSCTCHTLSQLYCTLSQLCHHSVTVDSPRECVCVCVCVWRGVSSVFLLSCIAGCVLCGKSIGIYVANCNAFLKFPF